MMRDHGGMLAPHGLLPVATIRVVARYRDRRNGDRYTLTRSGLLLMCVLEKPGGEVPPLLLWSRASPPRRTLAELMCE